MAATSFTGCSCGQAGNRGSSTAPRRLCRLPAGAGSLSWRVAGLFQCLAQAIEGIAHRIGLLVVLGIGAKLAPSHALDELREAPGFGAIEIHVDTNDGHDQAFFAIGITSAPSRSASR